MPKSGLEAATDRKLRQAANRKHTAVWLIALAAALIAAGWFARWIVG